MHWFVLKPDTLKVPGFFVSQTLVGLSSNAVIILKKNVNRVFFDLQR